MQNVVEKYFNLEEALSGELGDDAARIAHIGLHLVDTLLRKNQDYGSNVFQSPALCPWLPADTAMLCRMSDKVARIANLVDRESDTAVDESIDETMLDLAGYAILYLARLDGEQIDRISS